MAADKKKLSEKPGAASSFIIIIYKLWKIELDFVCLPTNTLASIFSSRAFKQEK